jgi:hypothetical protein
MSILEPATGHAKDSTPEFEAVEKQLAKQENEDQFLKPQMPVTKMSHSSTASNKLWWDQVIQRELPSAERVAKLSTACLNFPCEQALYVSYLAKRKPNAVIRGLVQSKSFYSRI